MPDITLARVVVQFPAQALRQRVARGDMATYECHPDGDEVALSLTLTLTLILHIRPPMRWVLRGIMYSCIAGMALACFVTILHIPITLRNTLPIPITLRTLHIPTTLLHTLLSPCTLLSTPCSHSSPMHGDGSAYPVATACLCMAMAVDIL